MHSCLLCLKQSQDFSLQVFLIKLNMIFYTTSQAKKKKQKKTLVSGNAADEKFFTWAAVIFFNGFNFLNK